MKFEINFDVDIPEDVSDFLDELAYDEAERIVALAKKQKTWPLERLIADSLRHCYEEVYFLREKR
jgi:hypothetical protein